MTTEANTALVPSTDLIGDQENVLIPGPDTEMAHSDSAKLLLAPPETQTPSLPAPKEVSDQPVCVDIEGQVSTLPLPNDEASSRGLFDLDPTANGEQEMARSREMSLSLESTGNPEGPEGTFEEVSSMPLASIPSTSQPVDPLQGDLDTTFSSSTAPISVDPINNTDPQTPKTVMKFPLPAKPPPENHTPLFAPSPPQASPDEPRSNPTRKPLLSRLATLKQRVEKDCMDGEAWLELIADAEKKGDLEKTREVYKSFLKNFPDAVSLKNEIHRQESNHSPKAHSLHILATALICLFTRLLRD